MFHRNSNFLLQNSDSSRLSVEVRHDHFINNTSLRRHNRVREPPFTIQRTPNVLFFPSQTLFAIGGKSHFGIGANNSAVLYRDNQESRRRRFCHCRSVRDNVLDPRLANDPEVPLGNCASETPFRQLVNLKYHLEFLLLRPDHWRARCLSIDRKAHSPSRFGPMQGRRAKPQKVWAANLLKNWTS